MDYPRALMKAMAEYPPRWDFPNWKYFTAMAYSPKETYAIHAYGVELRRRAWLIVAATQFHRDTAGASHEQVEARADDRGGQAQRSALPSSRASLFKRRSSYKSGTMPNSSRNQSR